MKFIAIVVESAKNVWTGASRFAIFSLALATTMTFGVLHDVASVVGSMTAAQEFRASGGHIHVLRHEAIDGGRCDGLKEFSGIEASGAVRTQGEARLSRLPDQRIQLEEVTPGFIGLLADGELLEEGQILLPERRMAEWGVRPGDLEWTDQGRFVVAGAFRTQGDWSRPLDSSVVTPVNSERPFSECWVALWPALVDVSELALVAIDPAADTAQATLTPLYGGAGLEFDLEQLITQRPITIKVLALSVLGGLLGFISGWQRRLAFASALHAGVRRMDLMAMWLIEGGAGCIAAIAMTAGAVTSVLIAEQFQPVATVGPVAVMMALVTTAGHMLGLLLAAVLIRESRLFRMYNLLE